MASGVHDGSRPSSGIYSCSKLKLDNLFLQWFSLPESQQLVSWGGVALLKARQGRNASPVPQPSLASPPAAAAAALRPQ